MVHLFNIFVEADNISCDYEPERSGKIGHVTVNTETEEELKRLEEEKKERSIIRDTNTARKCMWLRLEQNLQNY